MSEENSIDDAENSFIGKKVACYGGGGYFTEEDGLLKASKYFPNLEQGEFFVEYLSDSENKKVFALKAPGGKYVTAHLYGSELQEAIINSLAEVSSLPDALLPTIVSFLSDGDTTVSPVGEEGNFSYRALTLEDGPPKFTQKFTLVKVSRGRYGIRTRFGTFLRSAPWSKEILQSPHCLGDEQFMLTERE